MLELIWKPGNIYSFNSNLSLSLHLNFAITLDTYFLNGKESYLHKIPTSNRLVRLKKDGSVLYSSRLILPIDIF